LSSFLAVSKSQFGGVWIRSTGRNSENLLGAYHLWQHWWHYSLHPTESFPHTTRVRVLLLIDVERDFLLTTLPSISLVFITDLYRAAAFQELISLKPQ
jgi:hypothetical protein